MADGASRGCACHGGSRESSSVCVSGESRARRQRALAHPAFLEKRGLVGGWMGEGELQQHQGKEQPRPVWGRARQAWNSSLRGTGTGYPEQSQPLRPLCLFHRAPGPGASRRRAGHPSLARAGLPPEQMDRPAAGEPSSRRTRPPQKLPEAPVPTLSVPGWAPGKRNKAWKDLDEDTTL